MTMAVKGPFFANSEESEPVPGKRPYRKPELVRYGDVAELTKAGKPHKMRDSIAMDARTSF